ncbi:hypothetical protein ISN44_As09g005310 [Arabidopsis suecica]|uniref:Uncharacterized protein n=1 Tax=Arabidopsis suecica TaxID=45249 RepID=A0A8T2ADK0_ARASU|nr:hypothetical protein ISN44_As09g005310 [Arabidopsis suecica]
MCARVAIFVRGSWSGATVRLCSFRWLASMSQGDMGGSCFFLRRLVLFSLWRSYATLDRFFVFSVSHSSLLSSSLFSLFALIRLYPCEIRSIGNSLSCGKVVKG